MRISDWSSDVCSSDLVNAAAEGLFEISRRLALGTPLREAIVPFAPHERRLRDALDSSTGFIERELKLLRHGSVPVTVDLTVTPFVIDRKPGLLLEMVALDRHLRISRDDMLQTRFDASRELIRGLAHEIKNPLGGIRGAARSEEHTSELQSL